MLRQGDFHHLVRIIQLNGFKQRSIRFRNSATLEDQFFEVVNCDLDDECCNITTAHSGLIGSTGTLPAFVTRLVARQSTNSQLKSFLDACSEPFLRNEYDAWEQAHPLIQWEREQIIGVEESLSETNRTVFSFYGELKPRNIPVSALVFLSKYLIRISRNTELLGELLSEYFQLNCQVVESRVIEQNSEENGEAVSTTKEIVRIIVGPMGWEDFRSFLPGTKGLATLLELTFMYLGVGFEVEVELTLRASEIPSLIWGDSDCLLGLSTWFPDLPDGTHTVDKSIRIDPDTCRREVYAEKGEQDE